MAATITGPLLKSNGSLWTSAKLTFQRIKPRLAGNASGAIGADLVEVTTGAGDGDFTTTLETPATGKWRYRCTLPDGWTIDFEVADGDSTSIGAIIIASGLAESVTSATILDYLQAEGYVNTRALQIGLQGYSEYEIRVTQAFTNNPNIVSTLIDDLGYTVTPTREATGKYRFEFAGADFDETKVSAHFTPYSFAPGGAPNGLFFNLTLENGVTNNRIEVYTQNESGAASDNLLNGIIYVRVYA